MSSHGPARNAERETLFPPRARTEGGSLSTTAPRPSFAQPGSFNADLKSSTPRGGEPLRPELATFSTYRAVLADIRDDNLTTEQRQAEYRDKIDRELKIKTGTENLLDALNHKGNKQTKDQRLIVESELTQSNRKIAQLKQELAAEIQRAKDQPSHTIQPSRLSQLFKSSRARSPAQFENDYEDHSGAEEETESPTYALSNLLQSLEALGMPPDYYVERANSLVALFYKHATLKYDLVWSIFGLRMQALLLSDNREVAASGYRVLRYAIKDQKSLKTIRALHTDYLVILSMVKDSKASVEREQALKFVRAFLDVQGGITEISISIVRVIVAVAEHNDDRMRNMCILTLAEILVREPKLVLDAGGLGVLTETLAEGHYRPAESLSQAIVHLLDSPAQRRFLKSGHEIDGAFAAFTNGTMDVSEEKLKSSGRIISALLKTWAGLTVLSASNFSSIRSLMVSMLVPSTVTRDTIMELIMDVLRIKAPSWSSSFLAGRRLTTYGRVTHLKAQQPAAEDNTESREELVEHFVAILLAVFIKSGIIDALLFIVREEQDLTIRRKGTLLLGEILRMASASLPIDWTANLQLLPTLFSSASTLDDEDRHIASAAIYQIDSVNRTLYRTTMKTHFRASSMLEASLMATNRRMTDPLQDVIAPNIEEGQFRVVMLETQVLNTKNYAKWNWDMIEKVIDGPFQNPKRLDDAIKQTKFVKRLLKFYRPFEYRFCELANNKVNQRFIRIGCALVTSLLQHPEGMRYLAENKLLRQIAECLAQIDRLSGLTSSAPLFAAERLSGTLACGYFDMLGSLSADHKGLLMLERWKIFNMFYHIVELQERDDLIKLLIQSLDYSIDSHLRIILSKALTTASKEIRISATRILRKYAIKRGFTKEVTENVEWALDSLITQLYDPDVEVCEIAIKILEQACADSASLEFIVQRQPALDHLGEIGAPLLLKFLSTSIGYKYLSGLDYITQEMEDWYLGGNDTYVLVVEAALCRALLQPKEKFIAHDESQDPQMGGVAPPHFYRELTRTAEGCELLIAEGHFDGFVATIRNWGLENADADLLLKVKGALWAVGNIGSMELGASFLESTSVIPMIIRIAETSEVLSMRGTATYSLGLISRSVYGQEILAEYGWDSVTDENGCSIGVCLPSDLSKLFEMPKNPFMEVADDALATKESLLQDDDPTFVRILELVNDLNNTVLTKKRAGELHNLKAQSPKPFLSSRLFTKVMNLLERHHFRLPILRFVIDLFDKQVMRQIVYEEDEDEDFDTTIHAS